jgi:hypothetical protein
LQADPGTRRKDLQTPIQPASDARPAEESSKDACPAKNGEYCLQPCLPSPLHFISMVRFITHKLENKPRNTFAKCAKSRIGGFLHVNPRMPA